MKTSKKIIVAVAVFIMALFIICLVILRNDLMLFKTESEKKYKSVSIGNFEALDFSSDWKVRIIQGKECKLDLAVGEDRTLKPRVENIDGTLYFKPDTINGKENSGSIVARVTMPSIKAIKAVSGAKIHLENFTSDSLNVTLENAGDFTGRNNKFNYASFKTSGEARLEFTDTQEK